METGIKMDEITKRLYNNVLLARRRNPNFSTCNRCGLPWSDCDPKSIMYDKHNGCFAMCTYCWDISSVEERYHQLKKEYTILEHSGMRDKIDFGGKRPLINPVNLTFLLLKTKLENKVFAKN